MKMEEYTFIYLFMYVCTYVCMMNDEHISYVIMQIQVVESI